jgi:cobyrinic acid a,c-diamide synthase
LTCRFSSRRIEGEGESLERDEFFMVELPRIALGTVQPTADATAMTWALMETFSRRGLRVQHFLSHAYFCPRDGATAITGSPSRHLDSWLMSRDVCLGVFVRGCRNCDISLVEGSFVESIHQQEPASDFVTLCNWLDLPRLAIVDVRLLSACHLPERPAGLVGVLLDGVSDPTQRCHMQTLLEALWKVPVLGSLGLLPSLRAKIDRISCGDQPSLEVCQALGDAFASNARLDAIFQLGASRPLETSRIPDRDPTARASAAGLRVAVAYDEAFRGYFPDTLDLLELRGATILDFSPLRDESLPSHTDVVYIGCGHPELFARELSENHCLMLSLKSHASSGGRIYAECGGLAYLCQDLDLPDGSRWPMVGVLPSTAQYNPTPSRPIPTQIHLLDGNWLSLGGACWRGYLSSRWSLHPAADLQRCGAEAGHECDVVKCQQAVGSRIYVNLAAQSDLLDHFFKPTSPQPTRTVVDATPAH